MRRRTCIKWGLVLLGMESFLRRSAGADAGAGSGGEIVAVPVQTAAGAVYNPTVLGPGITAGWALASRPVLARLEAADFLPGMRRVGAEDTTEVLNQGSLYRNAPWYDVAKFYEERLRRQDFALVWIDSVSQFARSFEFREEPPASSGDTRASITESLRNNEPWKGTKPLAPARPGTRVAVTRTGELRARGDGVVGYGMFCAGIEILVATRAELSITLLGDGERAVVTAGSGRR